MDKINFIVCGEMLFPIINHSKNHRGQIVADFRNNDFNVQY